MLKRDRVALAITFLLPIAFFSIFAWIFGGASGGGSSMKAIRLIVADFDQSRLSLGMIDALDARAEINVVRASTSKSDAESAANSESTAPIVILSEEAARAQVRGGKCDAALLIPAGFSSGFPDFGGEGPAIQLIYDSANPMAQPSIVGLLQAAAFQSAPDALLSRGLEMLEASGLDFTEEQSQEIETAKQYLRDLVNDEQTAVDAIATEEEKTDEETTDDGQVGSASGFGGGMPSFVRVESSMARKQQDPSAAKKKRNQLLSYYAAGIGVMFLLFSTSGAAGTLLDEQDSGTLDRLLSSNLSMNSLLASHWLFYSLMGCLQLLLMFLWGKFVFGLDLFTPNHIAGCTVMATVTALAAAGFGMLLATVCRTRAQMGGISTIVILVMSALGGSMIPRFVMPAGIQMTSKFTFNGWAIDGFLKVFWYDDPSDTVWQSLIKLWPELLVLSLMTVVFMTVARLFAKRWEAV
jgi:ABC-2 type transport system permease protein